MIEFLLVLIFFALIAPRLMGALTVIAAAIAFVGAILGMLGFGAFFVYDWAVSDLAAFEKGIEELVFVTVILLVFGAYAYAVYRVKELTPVDQQGRAVSYVRRKAIRSAAILSLPVGLFCLSLVLAYTTS